MAEHGEEAAFELLLEDVRGESWVGNEHDVGQVSFGELEGFGAEDANFFCGVHVYVSVSVFVCPYLQILVMLMTFRNANMTTQYHIQTRIIPLHARPSRLMNVPIHCRV
mmetsp:Transcript_14235/g.20829  ORF Transcript_14235/g.20829 Transcript_14235/m.20829 type:complete len:109 (-) Transcript_14235:271-597(-)